MITFADVTNLAPELSTIAVAVQDEYLAFATAIVNRDRFGVLADRATALMCAHLLTVQKRASMGGSGGVSSVAVGSVSVAFQGVDSSSPSFLKQTGYGSMLLLLARSRGLSVRTTW